MPPPKERAALTAWARRSLENGRPLAADAEELRQLDVWIGRLERRGRKRKPKIGRTPVTKPLFADED